jgi:(p)ppGpp synthase/HD superfamily hydrolase
MSSESLDTKLEKIIAFGTKVHGKQMRKYTPDPYIVHPVRVMNMCKKYTTELPVLAAAILHDVLEDTPVSREAISGFLTDIMTTEEARKTLNLVVELTDVYIKDAYPQWNRRKRKTKELGRLAATSPESQTIKYADILDNCNEIVQHDPDFARVFLNECKTVLKKLDKGDKRLYEMAVQTVEEKLKELSNRKK